MYCDDGDDAATGCHGDDASTSGRRHNSDRSCRDLCSVCSQNQLLKIKQLANFVPQNEVPHSCIFCSLLNELMLTDVQGSHVALTSARQHLSYGDCLKVKRAYPQNCSVLDCVTHCSQSTAHLYEQFLQVKQIGFVTLGPLRCV